MHVCHGSTISRRLIADGTFWFPRIFVTGFFSIMSDWQSISYNTYPAGRHFKLYELVCVLSDFKKKQVMYALHFLIILKNVLKNNCKDLMLRYHEVIYIFLCPDPSKKESQKKPASCINILRYRTILSPCMSSMVRPALIVRKSIEFGNFGYF